MHAGGGRPATGHETEKVREGGFVGAAPFDHELAGPLEELGGHLGGFLSGASQLDEGFSDGREIGGGGRLRAFHGDGEQSG